MDAAPSHESVYVPPELPTYQEMISLGFIRRDLFLDQYGEIDDVDLNTTSNFIQAPPKRITSCIPGFRSNHTSSEIRERVLAAIVDPAFKEESRMISENDRLLKGSCGSFSFHDLGTNNMSHGI